MQMICSLRSEHRARCTRKECPNRVAVRMFYSRPSATCMLFEVTKCFAAMKILYAETSVVFRTRKASRVLPTGNAMLPIIEKRLDNEMINKTVYDSETKPWINHTSSISIKIKCDARSRSLNGMCTQSTVRTKIVQTILIISKTSIEY